MDEYSAAGFCRISSRGGGGTKCGRWNPTSEQVKVLTELFRSGLRTPSTDQIQKISSQLSFYGKIESKNVFYWFQNHKARERQKRRREHHSNINNNNDQLIILHTSTATTTAADTTKHMTDDENNINEVVPEPETLQLFPLLNEPHHHHHHHHHHSSVNKQLRLFTDNYCKSTHHHHHHDMDHPTLDLRLSFV